MALWQRDRDEQPASAGRVDTSLRRRVAIHVSFRLAEHLDAAGIAASIGSVGDAYDNALMESTIGLFKTELIKPRRPWKTLSQVELATAEWIDWYNHRRLHGEIGHVPPVEYEANYYHANHETPGHNHNLRSLPNPGRFSVSCAVHGTIRWRGVVESGRDGAWGRSGGGSHPGRRACALAAHHQGQQAAGPPEPVRGLPRLLSQGARSHAAGRRRRACESAGESGQDPGRYTRRRDAMRHGNG